MSKLFDMAEGLGEAAPIPGKNATILKAFIQGKSLNRFEAERLHDHCLNTTVSYLQNHHGISISRVDETVSCVNGRVTVRVKRYRLDMDPDNVQRAKSVLKRMEAGR